MKIPRDICTFFSFITDHLSQNSYSNWSGVCVCVCVSVHGHCHKFCDDTPSTATLSTLNNLPDLDPDYWRPVFWFYELQHMRAQGSNSVAWRVYRCKPAGTGSHLSTNGECLALIFVPAAHVFTLIGTVHFSSWLHKRLLKNG